MVNPFGLIQLDC